MALNPNIALNVKGLEVPNPVAQYAQVAQLQSLQNQNQVSQMQLDQMRRDDETLRQIQAKAVENGGPSDLNQIADAYLKSGNPKFVEFGIGLRQKLDDQAAFKRIGQMGAAPAPINAMARPSGALGSGTFGVFPEPTTNALAPAPAPTGPDVNTLRAKRDAYIALGTPQSIEAARAMNADIALLSKEPAYQNVSGVGLVDPRTGRVVVPSVESKDSVVKQYEYAQSQGFTGSLFDFKRKLAEATRPPAAPRPEAAPRTQQVTMSDGTLGIMNMDTGAITPANLGGAQVKGKPSAFAEKMAAQKAQMGKDLSFAITQLGDITKDGGLIDQSTGSGAGRLVDIGAGFVGQATKGAIAIGKIAPVADLVLKMVPRFEGPQSNKDTQSYKEAAGQLADPTLPTAIRKEAGKTVLRLMKERQGQFVSSDMAAENVAPAAAGGVVEFGSLK
jgi:hypothetical protein